MATFKITVFKHQKRADGKYPVSIRLTHNRSSVYIKTDIYVVEKQISKDFLTVRDKHVVRSIDKTIENFEDIITRQLGYEVKKMTARQLADFLLRGDESRKGIDFLQFSRDHLATQKYAESTLASFEATLNSLEDFTTNEGGLLITEVTSSFLKSFEAYLRKERTINRPNLRKPIVSSPVSDATVARYMTNIRTLFNAALDHYNDEEIGVNLITHYPFRKYKIQAPVESKSRALTIEVIRAIRDFEVPENDRNYIRMRLAKDVLLMSFFMAGINTVDLYNAKWSDFKDGRFTYERSKTRERRADNAYISLAVPPEALPLFEKYRDPKKKMLFDFHRRYKDSKEFNRAVNKGASKISTALGLEEDITSYYMRHSWATIANNDCKIDLESIGFSLNHSAKDRFKITRRYIKEDFSKIDDAIRKVLDYLSTERKSSIT